MRARYPGYRFSTLQRAAAAVFTPAIALSMQGIARAGGTPIWTNGEAGTVTFTPNPANSALPAVAVPINATATLTNILSSQLYPGPPAGTANYSAGLAHSESITSAKIIVASGTGVSQTDPAHSVNASQLVLFFDAQWGIPAAGFGAPISETFSLPIGAKIGANGSASATVKIDWDYLNASQQEIGFYEYDNSQTWMGGPSGQTILTSFTSPAVAFNPNSLNAEESLIMTASITFTANNDDSPTLIEIPTASDFSAFGVTSDEQGIISTYTPNSLTWNNAGAGTPADGVTWDTGNNQNFINNGSAGSVFTSGDYVTFNDSNNGHYNVSINSVVTPGAVLVNNSSGNYVFGGTGSIGGGAALTKSGSSALTLSTSNSYVGGTTLNAGTLNINNPSALGTGTFNIAGGTIDNTGATPIVLSTNNAQTWSANFTFGGTNSLNLGTGPVALATNVAINTQGSGSGGGSAVLTVGGTISGPFGLTKNGSGTLVLTGANTFSGLTTVNAGTLDFGSTSTTGIGYAGLAGGLNVSTGATVAVAAAATHSTRLLLTLGSLGFAGNSGTLDLANNDMDIQFGSLTTLIGELKQGYNNGHWNGTGGVISSTAAADTTHLTTLGVIENTNDGGMTALYSSSSGLGEFDGTSPSPTDLLVKYTYYGDTNLDGKVDGSDYSRIDAGFHSAATTWFNGDFNYDGVVNGSDYTLIDNAFNSQGTSLAAIIAGPQATVTSQIAGTAVPEPGTLGLLCLAATGMLARRKSRHRNTGLRPVPVVSS